MPRAIDDLAQACGLLSLVVSDDPDAAVLAGGGNTLAVATAVMGVTSARVLLAAHGIELDREDYAEAMRRAAINLQSAASG